MKKLTAILLTLALLMSSAWTTVFAEDEPATDVVGSSLAFELDFSRFEETGKAFDSVSGRELWLAGDATVTPKVSSFRALAEGGNISYITLAPDATSFSGDFGGQALKSAIQENVLGQPELTFETWVRSQPFSGRWDRVFAIGGDTAVGQRLDMEINEGSTTFRVGLGNFEGSERTITTDRNLWNGEWQHIVVNRKYDNGTLTANVYANGELLGTQTVTDVQDPAIWERDKWEVEQEYKRTLAIGATPDGVGVFRGDMASFRIYNKVLTEEEMNENYTNGKAGLKPLVVSNLDFSNYDGTAETVKDTGACGNATAIRQSEAVRKGTYTNLKGEEVVYFDMYEDGDYRGRGWLENNIYGELEDYTVGAWVRIPDYTKRSWGTIIAHTDRNGYDSKIYGTEFADNSFNLRAWDVQGNYVSIEPYQDTWAYITLTKEWTKNENDEDVLTLKAYMNGRELTGAAVSGVAYKDAYLGYTAFGLGSFFPSPADGGTLIDFSGFTVYAKAFSAAEVAAEYAAMREDYTALCEIDVNFDNFDGVNASTLSNRNADTNAEFHVVVGDNAEDAKQVKEFASKNGTTKYLAVDQSKDHRLLVTAEGISGQDDISIEMWAKYNEGWGRFFCATPQLQVNDGGQYLDSWLDASDDDRSRIVFYPFGNDGDDSGKGVIEGRHFEHDWTHFVFNRKLVSQADGVAQYRIEVYQNGVLKSSTDCEAEFPQEDKMTFTVMGSGYCGTAKADLGSFIVRNKTLSADEIAATYALEADSYKPADFVVSATKVEGSTASYDVEVKNETAETLPCTIVLVAYEAVSKAYAGCETYVVKNGIAGGECAGDTLTVENLDANKNYDFKVFVWDSMDSLKPYGKGVAFH